MEAPAKDNTHRQTVDAISGGIRVESAAGVSEEISAWEVGGLRVIRSGLLIYGQDGQAPRRSRVADRGPSKRRL